MLKKIIDLELMNLTLNNYFLNCFFVLYMADSDGDSFLNSLLLVGGFVFVSYILLKKYMEVEKDMSIPGLRRSLSIGYNPLLSSNVDEESGDIVEEGGVGYAERSKALYDNRFNQYYQQALKDPSILAPPTFTDTETGCMQYRLWIEKNLPEVPQSRPKDYGSGDEPAPCYYNWQDIRIPSNIDANRLWREWITCNQREIVKWEAEKKKQIGDCYANLQRQSNLDASFIADTLRKNPNYDTTNLRNWDNMLANQSRGICQTREKAYTSFIQNHRNNINRAMQQGPVEFTRRIIAVELSSRCKERSGISAAKRAHGKALEKMAEENFRRNITLPDRD